VQWLIDTPTRLAQYRDLARAQRTPLRINIEIDVGLRRGGVADDVTLREMIQLMQHEPWLRWSGLMGYDAHTQKIPDVAGSRARAHEYVLSTYRARLAALLATQLPQQDEALTLNTGGSSTYRLHRADGPANDVALGSALVKPSDFDIEALADLQPAAWIATPVLKVQAFRTPQGVGALGTLAQAWDRNQRTAHHLHGGHWLARPVSPAGLQASGLIGPSSNQQLFLGSGRQALQPDELVFFRPTQSEAVLQQFGDIAVVEGDRVTAWWPVFPARA
jgi:D-serine deaminase-like pyridoxal phosphate-dependent protein